MHALDAGADDYVTKPVGMSELSARVRANLRRAPSVEPERMIKAGAICIDLDGHKVTVQEQEVRLTPKEFEVLVYLARNLGKVVTHRKLLAAVWGGENTEQPEYLRVFINRLRNKLEPYPDAPRYIITEPHIGYRFESGSSTH